MKTFFSERSFSGVVGFTVEETACVNEGNNNICGFWFVPFLVRYAFTWHNCVFFVFNPNSLQTVKPFNGQY